MTDTSFADQISATGIAQRSGFHVPHDFSPPKGASLGLQAALALYIIIQGAVVASSVQIVQMMQRLLNGDFASEDSFYAELTSLESLSNMLFIATIASFVICVLAYCVFVYTAASNIQRANAKGHDHSPGWSVGLSFIPIANLVFIFTVMRGIWKASHDPKQGLYATSIILPVWWILYVGSNIANNGLSRIADGYANTGDIEGFAALAPYMIGALVAGIVSAILLVFIVRAITRAQANWPSLATTAP